MIQAEYTRPAGHRLGQAELAAARRALPETI